MPPQKKNTTSLLQDIISQIYNTGEGAVNTAKDFYFKPDAQATEPVAQPREIPLPSTTQYPEKNIRQPQEEVYQPGMIESITAGKGKRLLDRRQVEMERILKGF